VGPTGSGKSSHLLNYVQLRYAKSRKYVLNDMKGDLGSKKKRFKPVDWDYNFARLRHSVLICEDLIHLKPPQVKLLTTFINVLRRHRDNTCFLVSHSLRNNNIYSLLQHVNYFVFLSGHANLVNFKVVCSIFNLPDGLKSKGLDFFSNPPGKYYSLVLNTETFETAVFNPSYHRVESPERGRPSRTDILNQFELVFKPFPNGSQMFALATFLVSNLPVSMIRPDLSIGGRSPPISLIDYISVISGEHSKVSKPMYALHKFLKSHVTIPHLFVRNQRFHHHHVVQ